MTSVDRVTGARMGWVGCGARMARTAPAGRVARPVASLATALLVACASPPSSAPARARPLGGELARVGDVVIPRSLLSAVARADGTPPREAFTRLMEDALLAQAARARSLNREEPAAWSSICALAARQVERIDVEARSRGAPGAEELSSVRVVHAVVLRGAGVSMGRAVAAAETLRAAALEARDPDQFVARTQAVPHAGLEVRVERLPPFDATGTTPDGQSFDAAFVAAALQLRSPGETSPVVETPFGWHVIRLIERIPAGSARDDAAKAALVAAALEARSRAAVAAHVRALRGSSSIEIAADADERMTAAVQSLNLEPP